MHSMPFDLDVAVSKELDAKEEILLQVGYRISRFLGGCVSACACVRVRVRVRVRVWVRACAHLLRAGVCDICVRVRVCSCVCVCVSPTLSSSLAHTSVNTLILILTHVHKRSPPFDEAGKEKKVPHFITKITGGPTKSKGEFVYRVEVSSQGAKCICTLAHSHKLRIQHH